MPHCAALKSFMMGSDASGQVEFAARADPRFRIRGAEELFDCRIASMKIMREGVITKMEQRQIASKNDYSQFCTEKRSLHCKLQPLCVMRVLSLSFSTF